MSDLNPRQIAQSQSSQSQSRSQTPASTSAANSSVVVIPQTAPAGVLTVTQPPQTATSFYKIASGQLITFAWNFTGVLATPTHLTVSAVCDNGNTYPVGPTDGIIPGTATSVVWDPYGYDNLNPNTPLAQAGYTLHIWDDRGPDATLRPGYLQPNSAVKFALYTPQAYTPLASGWTCAGCSGSISNYTTHPAFTGIIVTFFIMFMSGFNVLRRAPR